MKPKGVAGASYQKFIDVKDNPPEIGVWVLIWNTAMGYDVDMIREDGIWALTRDPVSHWAPLPKPPMEVNYAEP